MYQRKIESEKTRIKQLDDEILRVEKLIFNKQRIMGPNANRESSAAITKKIRQLENRLDKALVKYNEALGFNKNLREQIDNLRRERLVFDGIYKKLEDDLEGTKNEMAGIIREANESYGDRDRAQHDMIQLKDQADR